MKNIKNYKNFINEDIKHKDINEQIDEILDNLNKKGKLSNSENEFMEAASKDEITEVSIPRSTGSFWGDMSDPHNLGILWKGKDNIWKQLKSLEEERDESLEETETSDQRWERKKNEEILKYAEELPELTDIINEWAIEVKNFSEKQTKYYNKLKKLVDDKDDSYKYKFMQKLDYATNGTLNSLFNQFGPIITSIKNNFEE